MIKQEKWGQFGFKREVPIEGITIHNTNNYDLSAIQIFDWMNDESKDPQGAHFIVDKNDIVECMPLDYSVYHTGKGMDFGNKYTIAIYICSSLNDEEYIENELNAMNLIKRLLSEYNLSKNDIYFHRDFNKVIHCPNDILNRYKTKVNFISTYFNGKE